MLICYRYGKNGERDVIGTTAVGMIQRGCCNFGKTEIKQPAPGGSVEDGEGDEFMAAGPKSRGPPESQKGFSDKAARKYARGVAVSAKFGLEDDLIKHHIEEYLKENEDIQELWNKVATAVSDAEATDDGATARSGSRVPVNQVEEDDPEDSDAVTKTERT